MRTQFFQKEDLIPNHAQSFQSLVFMCFNACLFTLSNKFSIPVGNICLQSSYLHPIPMINLYKTQVSTRKSSSSACHKSNKKLAIQMVTLERVRWRARRVISSCCCSAHALIAMSPRWSKAFLFFINHSIHACDA